MSLVVRAFPVSASDEEVDSFIREVGERKDARAFFESFGVRREEWFRQRIGDATYVIAVSDVTEPLEETARAFSTTTDDFAQWFQANVLRLSGVDQREQPLGPETKLVFDSTGGSFRLDGTLVVRMYPVLSVKALYDLTSELEKRRDEVRAFYDDHEASENWFLQQTEHGPHVIAVASLNGDVHGNAYKYAESRDPFAVWFKQRVIAVSGVNPNETPLGPPSEQVFAFAQ